MTRITVRKLNEKGQETWRYQAELLERSENRILLQAQFDRPDTQVDGMLLAKGDRFLETYFTDRWYNIFEIHACTNDHLRGWYCNIGCPAEIHGDTLSYIDLALDLLVFPDGRQVVMDEEEFRELDISDQVRAQAINALEELKSHFRNRTTGNPEFDSQPAGTKPSLNE